MYFLFFVGYVLFMMIALFVSFEPKSTYEKWLEKELERNPDYINWLKEANNGKNYKLGLKINERNRNRFYKLLKKIRG